MIEHKTWCPAHRHALNSETTISNAGVATVGTYTKSKRNRAMGRAGHAKVKARKAECGCGATGQYVRLRKAFAKARRRAEEGAA